MLMEKRTMTRSSRRHRHPQQQRERRWRCFLHLEQRLEEGEEEGGEHRPGVVAESHQEEGEEEEQWREPAG